ncbi:MAG: DUF2148 domain-containing protein [Bacteroidota bacterium]
MLFTEEDILDKAVMDVAEKMLLAARTAPKGRGRNSLVFAIADRKQIDIIANKMEIIARRNGTEFFNRDAKNLRLCPALFIAGTRIEPLGLKFCGNCGLENCDNKKLHPTVPCAFNNIDLGIAIGSAASVAANHRVDNRVMFSAGKAILELGLLGDDVKIIFGIPLAAISKSPFFDR